MLPATVSNLQLEVDVVVEVAVEVVADAGERLRTTLILQPLVQQPQAKLIVLAEVVVAEVVEAEAEGSRDATRISTFQVR